MTAHRAETSTHDADPSCGPAEGSSRVLLLFARPGGEGAFSSVVELHGAQALTVGRGVAATLRLHSPALSRQHARFEREGGAVVVRDLGSHNGTWVGGRRMRKATLRDGEVAVLGDVTVTVVVVAALGAASPGDSHVVRASAAMLAVQRLVERAAPSDLPVLVVGESGTGKEVVARELHRLSRRAAAPMVVVHCAAIAPRFVESVLFGQVRGASEAGVAGHQGVFEQAAGGTIFLDEVGELSPAAQASLLRVLDTKRILPVGAAVERQVDVRVLAATHRDLPGMIADKTFRLDLYHRLNAVTVALPPLRERRDDIAPLAAHFMAAVAAPTRDGAPHIAPEALETLVAHRWPGNVRELRNVVERALLLGDARTLMVADLPDDVRAARAAEAPAAPLPTEGVDLRRAVRSHENSLIRGALERTNGHRARAARLLNLSLRTFERKVREAKSEAERE